MIYGTIHRTTSNTIYKFRFFTRCQSLYILKHQTVQLFMFST